MISKYKIARQIGTTPTHVINVLNGKEYASFPKAVDIEIATGGEVKVEDIVRPEVAESLQKFLRLRCPMFSNLQKEEEGVSK